ncbi:unnamed protein product [Effrenium voratum]|uniref:Uncharacterized protein n=1 Tax=Effrenium voratum TaxID=2562239 RepID=A0AA36JS60_9DINO|nr:unnamed protein product [Effrenium voratum]
MCLRRPWLRLSVGLSSPRPPPQRFPPAPPSTPVPGPPPRFDASMLPPAPAPERSASRFPPPAPPAPPVPAPADAGSRGSPTLKPGTLDVPESHPQVQAVLLALKKEGMRRGLERHWEQIKRLHQQDAFTPADIAWLFAQCRSVPSLRRAQMPRSINRHDEDEADVPIGTRVVQLFTNFVCLKIPELTPGEITCFVSALTSAALPMDEFWLFMMAKQIQDTSGQFSCVQLAEIARCYAAKGLEDEEFFGVLCDAVFGRLQEFHPNVLAHFLFSCARVRFLHEDLCTAAFPLFEDVASVRVMDATALSSAITAASLLDWRGFKALVCCQALAARTTELSGVVHHADLAMGLALAVVYMRNAAGARFLLPFLLDHFCETLAGASLRRSRSEVATIQRRVTLTGLCAAFGVPKRQAWDLNQLRIVQVTFNKLQSYLAQTGSSKDSYEPTPSSFHLEVVAVLHLLNVQHQVEQPQRPFMLDITIRPEQLRSSQT